ncbi:hypothetical protein QBC32DRAFT_329763 [Pseudoneurospora amorphoporcata]|uniref:C2H2-type domain-containing protein n=1 Tax=Pseudoneurospora amorphoporcata TaxID=241081 RepID=A0AAN6P3F4_9PEZI|nr:hypothetical protein QBC32DRAFT_329763 [Pseudoneurospora amorphoporcata]
MSGFRMPTSPQFRIPGICLRPASLTKVNSLWRLSDSTILQKDASEAIKPLYPLLVAQNGGSPVMARHTCMTCLKGFESRNDLFDHLEKATHAVNPHTGRVGDYSRPMNCLPGAKKLMRQEEQNQQREARTQQYETMRQELLGKIQNCNSQLQRDIMESTLWRLEQKQEKDYRKYVETETLRIAKGRSTCKCELCGRTCHNLWKLIKHKCHEHGFNFKHAKETTTMRLRWICGRLSLDGQGCHLHSV